MAKFTKGDIVYIVISNLQVEAAQILYPMGGRYSLQLCKNYAGRVKRLSLPPSRLFTTEEEARSAIKKHPDFPFERPKRLFNRWDL